LAEQLSIRVQVPAGLMTTLRKRHSAQSDDERLPVRIELQDWVFASHQGSH